MTSLGHEIGLAGEQRKRLLEEKIELIGLGKVALDKSLPLDKINTVLTAQEEKPAKEKTKTNKLVARPNIKYARSIGSPCSRTFS